MTYGMIPSGGAKAAYEAEQAQQNLDNKIRRLGHAITVAAVGGGTWGTEIASNHIIPHTFSSGAETLSAITFLGSAVASWILSLYTLDAAEASIAAVHAAEKY